MRDSVNTDAKKIKEKNIVSSDIFITVVFYIIYSQDQSKFVHEFLSSSMLSHLNYEFFSLFIMFQYLLKQFFTVDKIKLTFFLVSKAFLEKIYSLFHWNVLVWPNYLNCREMHYTECSFFFTSTHIQTLPPFFIGQCSITS